MLRFVRSNTFWTLSIAVAASVTVAGFIQFIAPDAQLQIIRIEQIYGLSALSCLYIALIAPLLEVIAPRQQVTLARLRRRACLLACYLAFLHASLTFFKQLGGWHGVSFLGGKYLLAVCLGATVLSILFVTAGCAVLVPVVPKMGRVWQWLQQVLYVAGVLIAVHVLLVGTHFEKINLLSIISASLLFLLLFLWCIHIYHLLATHKRAGAAL